MKAMRVGGWATLWMVGLSSVLGSCSPAPEPPIWVAVEPAEAEDEKNRPSGAMQALRYWGAQRAYPDRTLPDSKFGVALDQARQMRNRRLPDLEDAVAPWDAIGPENIGGRTLCLALQPGNPDVIFAGSASGGWWKSTTGGVGADAWDYLDTGYPVLGVSTIVIDPTDTDVMYIGTGVVRQRIERFRRIPSS